MRDILGVANDSPSHTQIWDTCWSTALFVRVAISPVDLLNRYGELCQTAGTTILLVKDDQTAKIHLKAVIGFEHERRQFGDKQRPTLTVDHAPTGTTIRTPSQ
jgi:hypothetical protein